MVLLSVRMSFRVSVALLDIAQLANDEMKHTLSHCTRAKSGRMIVAEVGVAIGGTADALRFEIQIHLLTCNCMYVRVLFCLAMYDVV